MTGKYQAYIEHKESCVDFLDAMPIDWSIKKGKFVFKEFNERSTTGDETLLSVSEYYGVKPREDVISDGDFLSRAESLLDYKKCEKNDLVMNIMLAWKRGLGVTKFDGIVSPAYSVFRFNELANPDYMHYLLRTDTYTDHFKTRSTGVIDSRLRLYPESFGNVPILLPPIKCQEQIATFLDHETAKIDTLIAKQEQLIALLKEKRQAVISHAVTKGLNPNAPMRDSGVEWLGEVPAHWGVKKFKYLCDRIIAGPFGSSITKDMYVKQGYKVYGQEQVIPNDFSVGDYYINEKHYLELFRYIVCEGDILISCVGTFGKVAVFPKEAEPGIINPRLIKAEASPTHNPSYIRELLKSEMVFKQFELLSRGGTMGVINIAILSEILAAVPPESEQSEIVEHIWTQKKKFNHLIEKAQSAIELMQERRTALISAAVTGKIDVRDWQVPEPSNNANNNN
jgi:type I restriction enzyme S subunit